MEERKVFAYALDKIVNGSRMSRDAAGSGDRVSSPASAMSTVPPPDPSKPQLLIRFEEVAFVQRVRRLSCSTVMKKRVNFHFPLIPNAGLQARERQGCEPEDDSEQWQQRHQNVFRQHQRPGHEIHGPARREHPDRGHRAEAAAGERLFAFLLSLKTWI